VVRNPSDDQDLAFDGDGLIPAIAQDRFTGEVRMLAYMSRESIEATHATGRATFFSRSRNELWEKGATSGHPLRVERIVADCDADALLLLVDPVGPTCHTGRPSCFYRALDDQGKLTESTTPATPWLSVLEAEIESRKGASAKDSYTKTLLDGGAEAIGEKLREEADELARAISAESDERVTEEGADVLYHLMVGLTSRGLSLRDVISALAARAGVSGHAEKAARRKS